MAGNGQDLMPAEFAGTGGTPAQGDVPAVPAGGEEDEMHDWDVVSHTLWSIIPGVIIIVAVVLCMLEFLGLRGAAANPVVTGRKPQVLCIILLGSGGASAPLVKALLDLQYAFDMSMVCKSKLTRNSNGDLVIVLTCFGYRSCSQVFLSVGPWFVWFSSS